MTTVKIKWNSRMTMGWWNECCAWTCEQFGLPGDKYTTTVSPDYMLFTFREDKDAEFFALRWAS
jgi:hypothetical protein